MKSQLKLLGASLLATIVMGIATSAQEEQCPEQLLHNIVYFTNPDTGRLGLYFSYALQPNHEYSMQVTWDGVHFGEIAHYSTKGDTQESYTAYTLGDPRAPAALWPRMVDLGPSSP